MSIDSSSGREAGRGRKKLVSSLVKLTITCVLLYLIYSKLSLVGVKERLLSFDLGLFVLIGFFYLLGQLISIFKWNMFLRDTGISVTYRSLIKPYFAGMFVNTFGFGTVGGDLARALLVSVKKGERGRVVSSVVADRVHGLVILLVIGTVASVIYPPKMFPSYLIYMLLALILVFAISWIFVPRVLQKLIPESISFLRPLVLILESFPKTASVLLRASLVSLVFHSIQITMAYYIFLGIGSVVDWSLVFTSIPFINIASSLPISINGLGVREAVSVYLLEPSGVMNEASVSFSAVWILVVSCVSGLGGIMLSLFSKLPLIIKDEKDLKPIVEE